MFANRVAGNRIPKGNIMESIRWDIYLLLTHVYPDELQEDSGVAEFISGTYYRSSRVIMS